MKARLAMLACIVVGACMVRAGPQPKNYGPAHTVSGVQANVWTANGQTLGELLEVRDDAIVLYGSRAVLIPFDAIERSAFEATSTVLNRTSHESKDIAQVR